MKTISKLFILEFIAGTLGWVSIGASMASLYFLVMAIFTDSAWSLFFWTFGISVVAKWLTAGFVDNRNRVTYEAKLIADGYKAEEAGKMWIEQYTGAPKAQTSSDDDLAIVQAYGNTLETSAPTPCCVADESKLPFKKERIKKAIINMLHITEDENMRNHLKVGYMELAGWQPGVGDSDQGIDLSKIKTDINQDPLAHAKAITEQSPGFDKWMPIANKEREVLYQELQGLGF